MAKDYVKQWKRVTRRGVPRHKMSILSVIRFFPGWVKYYVIPQPFRYLWYLVWSRAVEAHHAYHKWACLQGMPCALSLHGCWQAKVEPICCGLKVTVDRQLLKTCSQGARRGCSQGRCPRVRTYLYRQGFGAVKWGLTTLDLVDWF